jgi:hypothetical protein
VNSVFWRIFRLTRDKVIRGWRKLLNEELRNLHSAPSINIMIKPRRMGWVGHLERKGEKEHN